jgi:hypothetical protein
MKLTFSLFRIVLLSGFLISISFSAKAQQTIFSVPSADVTPEDKNFVQHESQFRTKDPGEFWAGTHYVAKGIGYNTEIDAAFFNLSSPASKNVSFAPGFKSVIPIQIKEISSYQPKIIFGSMMPFSLQGNGIGNWTYLENSFFIPESGTRLTAGISFGTKQIFGKDTICFIGGFEQKITNNLSYISDWYSGNNTLGVFSTGISYALPKDIVFYGGYQIPNSKKIARNGFIIEIAKIF